MQELSEERIAKLACRLADLEGRMSMHQALSKYDREEASCRLQSFLFRAFVAKGIEQDAAEQYVIDISNAVLNCDSFIEEDHINEIIDQATQLLR